MLPFLHPTPLPPQKSVHTLPKKFGKSTQVAVSQKNMWFFTSALGASLFQKSKLLVFWCFLRVCKNLVNRLPSVKKHHDRSQLIQLSWPPHLGATCRQICISKDQIRIRRSWFRGSRRGKWMKRMMRGKRLEGSKSDHHDGFAKFTRVVAGMTFSWLINLAPLTYHPPRNKGLDI